MNSDIDSKSSSAVHAELRAEIEQFLFLEARFIDEQRWEDWLELYHDSAIYWVPTGRHQNDPLQQASIVYEEKLGLELRIKRRKHPQAHSLDRMPESTHLISNIMLDQVDVAMGSLTVSSSFIMLGYQEDISNSQTVYGGRYLHELMRVAGELKIARKKVVLNNCDAPLRNIQLFF